LAGNYFQELNFKFESPFRRETFSIKFEPLSSSWREAGSFSLTALLLLLLLSVDHDDDDREREGTTSDYDSDIIIIIIRQQHLSSGISARPCCGV
jgi:hypothetical protein